VQGEVRNPLRVCSLGIISIGGVVAQFYFVMNIEQFVISSRQAADAIKWLIVFHHNSFTLATLCPRTFDSFFEDIPRCF